jgi:CBS domain containing-hemolysin-like protein
LEEVVGEIYDEDDVEEATDDLRNIFIGEDGTINMRGIAELSDVYDALKLKSDDDALLKFLDEYSTIGGLLCSLAGKIPSSGETIAFSGYAFTVTEVDDRRVLAVTATALVKPEDTSIVEQDQLIFRDGEWIEKTGDENSGSGSDDIETSKGS